MAKRSSSTATAERPTPERKLPEPAPEPERAPAASGSQNGNGTATAAVPLPERDTMRLEIPALAEVPEHVYCPGHVEVQLTKDQSRTLKRLTHTLEFSGATVRGRPVNRIQHAVVWLLEKLGAGA